MIQSVFTQDTGVEKQPDLEGTTIYGLPTCSRPSGISPLNYELRHHSVKHRPIIVTWGGGTETKFISVWIKLVNQTCLETLRRGLYKCEGLWIQTHQKQTDAAFTDWLGIVTFQGQLHKVPAGFRSLLGPQLDVNVARRGLQQHLRQEHTSGRLNKK